MSKRNWFKRRDDWIDYPDGTFESEVWNSHLIIGKETDAVFITAIQGPYSNICEEFTSRQKMNDFIDALQQAGDEVF